MKKPMKQTAIRFSKKEWNLIEKIQKDTGLPSFACTVRYILRWYKRNHLGK